jgi:hypothetical protein
METAFKIISYTGPKPLLFGMTKEQAEALVGHPLTIRPNNLGEQDASYKTFSIRYSKDSGSLVEVGFSPNANVDICGLKPFEQPNAWLELLRQDTAPYECLGFIVLLNLGITLTGFHDNDLSQRAITAFNVGRWDDFRTKFASKFKLFPIPKA